MRRYLTTLIATAVVAITAPATVPSVHAAPHTIGAGPVSARGTTPTLPSGRVADIPNVYRMPICSASPQFHSVAVYAHPSNFRSRYGSLVDDVQRAVMRADAFVHDEARRNGVARLDFKFACTKGQITVLDEALPTPSYSDSFETIENDLRNAGLLDTAVKYWVWYDDGVPDGACGEARRMGDSSLAVTNRANQGPDFAIAYGVTTACGSVSSTLLHEFTHTMGAVAPDAWGSDRHGHCTDGMDVMCQTGNLCPVTRYDCGKDTYFDPAPTPGEYLYAHWNLAFCINRFISRTGCTTAPRTLKANYSAYAITLHWVPPTSTGGAPLDHYEIFRRSCDDCTMKLLDTVIGSRTSYTDFGVETLLGFRYEYQVRAVNVWKDAGPLSNRAAAGFI